MKRFALLLASAVALAAPAAALAHPLGNFTTNHYSRVVLSGDRIYVLYVLDLAEIPTFQAQQRVRDEGGNSTEYARAVVAETGRALRLSVDGRPVRLMPLRNVIGFPPGVAGLRTTRLEALFATDELGGGRGSHSLTFRDESYPGRIGWKEIVAGADSGARLVSSTAPSRSVSNELRAYPKDLLLSPLDVRSAGVSFVPGDGPGTPPLLSTPRELRMRVAVRAGSEPGFSNLIAHTRLSAGFVFLALVLAFFWGAAHAFSPVHGKSIIAAYLVGTRGTPRHAVLLGLTVTITHTIGVFALGAVTLALSQFLLPEQLYPWLNLSSALLVLSVGATVLRARLRAGRHRHGHSHGHAHDGCGCGHEDHAQGDLTLRGLLGIGISGGLIPCPSALVVLLAAISLHRIGYGLVLILVFSTGLAAAMTSIGLLAVSARRLFRRVNLDGRAIRLLPAASAVVVVGLGVAMTVRALGPVT
jgi:ABC-type nickel/cobalt efflux system permease component RcnA